jgi:TonB family protein
MRGQIGRAAIFALALALPAAPLIAADIDDGQAAYDTGDYATALKIWQPIAEQGNARAQNNLGVMFENGKGVAQDTSAAVKWYRLAAAQGYGGAEYNLGLIYAIGRGGVPHDPLRAYMWFSIAAASLSGDVGMLVTQTRDVFATAMTAQQIAAANAMADACRQSSYQNCEPAGDLAPGVAASPSNTTPAIARTPHTVTAADYPRDSLRFHESGDVTVTYLISESGAVTACAVILSSRNPRLDQAACEMVKKHWRYEPATEDGHPVSIQYISKISFPRR